MNGACDVNKMGTESSVLWMGKSSS